MPLKIQRLNAEQPAIANLVRELRQAMKLSQSKFADELGMTFPTINRWENGHATPSPLALKQIYILLSELANSPDATLRECSKALRSQYFSDWEEKA
ncbi:helix-turn-helix domain-containing protein [Argonema antarcticum]|uniref:helix-turn-helix domain-containing protein n=1 Tax=Argonema antarcticum TaxID=2942763 RepID=UPI0020118752|nr:helix-turn-helix transcriptional regulator [Argonema antarcticum]MCL1475293.1 helix-turn-helix domain-containing protein [Argonema antarcticum A004/B2]